MAMPRLNYYYYVDGVNIYNFRPPQKVISKQKERIEYYQDVLYPDGQLHNFFVYFFDETKNKKESIFCPNASDPLSHDINICKELETMANYILFSPDAERLTRKTEYNFYKEEDKFKNKMKDLSLDRYDSPDEALDILLDSNHNYYLETNQKIFASDKKRFPVLLDYEEVVEYFSEKIKKDGEYEKGSRRKISNLISSLHIDQKDLKSMLAGTIVFKHVASSGEKIDEPDIDGFNFDAVYKMFENADMHQVTPFGDLKSVFKHIMKTIELNETDLIIMDKILDDKKPNFSEIGRDLNLDKRTVQQSFTKLRNKIVRKYMRMYEMYVGTFEEYSWWKQCSVCGKVKLLSPTYYQKDPNSNDGFRSVCKNCI